MTLVQERIKKIMSIVFEVPIDQITETSSKDTIEHWDSLRHLNLIMALEEEFEITIPDEEVDNLINLKLIELIINDCKNNVFL